MEPIIVIFGALIFRFLVFIPVVIIVMLIRAWLIKTVTLWKYSRRYKRYRSFGFDPSVVPTVLHDLIPFASKWGISDDTERHSAQQQASRKEKLKLARTIKGKEGIIKRWISIPQFKNTPEANKFGILLKSVYEMGFLIEPTNDENISRSHSFQYPYLPLPNTRLIYYAPRPKTVLEKWLYDIFSAIIALIVFPFSYYALGKTWANFQTDVPSHVGIPILSTAAAILSILIVKAAQKVFFRLARGW